MSQRCAFTGHLASCRDSTASSSTRAARVPVFPPDFHEVRKRNLTCVFVGLRLLSTEARWLIVPLLNECSTNTAVFPTLSPLSSLFLQYKGQANLHVFEDWCGSSTADLRKNLHYPLYPHSRTTVQKLAVSPQWTNYGLRIFGYLHPYTDGEFVFALSSDDNSELWLSTDDSPLNLQLLSWVGKTGTEWTAPGEFDKYASQTSRPVRLSAQRRYFFEVIHKQNNKGTDHVEVALLDQDSRFMIVESKHISLYVNESALLMSDVGHIPQTAASHQHAPTKHSHAADMLSEDPRDTFYQVMCNKFLQGVLPDCSYNPSYTIKDFPLLRYQGLQFVHMSYIYPNDYTRLTHMETEKSCFYPESPYYMKMFGFSRYMRLDRPGVQESGTAGRGVLYFFPNKSKFLILPVLFTLLLSLFLMFARFWLPEEEIIKTIPREKTRKKWSDVEGEVGEEDEVHDRAENQRSTRRNEGDSLWGPGKEFDGADDEDQTPAPVFDTQVSWNQTFQVSHLDLQAQRSDWIDLRCNISGNLLLHSSDALPIVEAFMEQLNEKHHGQFTLVRVVNVVKRVDGVQGSRYLLELEVKDANGQLLRLSRYIYALIRRSRRSFSFQRSKPQLVLCNPVGFQWNPVATVHFIVPVKNQARWVQQLITDMESLFRETGDTNFNLIITDYNSTDMDVRKALQKSSLPRYQYVKLSGNFERSAGLQAGVDLINDDHSIVFLCDLHIHFPPSIIDTIRKHCVEGYMAFAPIVLRLDCGTTPLEARGYWEVNGFGLLGIYKSDLDTVGGMNTREFTDRWGGEDWELLDRILHAGLEVERIYLRNFSHHYHSKRGMWNRRMSEGHRG
uniref:Beta-1,4-N-acetylgalactosaminyltransferase n=1 Tax=Amphiprion ocellaris TaxID=80972 RepID=A0AAQ6A256_AMPOC